MEAELLPLFPLNVVLFPRTPLPLHIFEERYKLMIGLALEHDSEFGIVLAAEDGIVTTGCTAKITRLLQKYPDGRMDILTHGRRRFEIHRLDQSKPYLQGEVEFFDDEEGNEDDEPLLRDRAFRALQDYLEATGGSPNEVQPADPQISFQLAQGIGDLEVRQTLLGMRSEGERLRHLAAYFSQQAERTRRSAFVRKLAARNGHHKVSLP